ncbi:hypothetical protein [Intestinibacter sp.]
MKKILNLLLVLVIGTTMIGCSSSTTVSSSGENKSEEATSTMSTNKSEKKKKTYDKEFLENLSKGLEESIELTNKYLYSSGVEQYNQFYKDTIDVKLDNVKKYKDMDFENSELKNLAVRYVDLLQRERQELSSGELGNSPNNWYKEEVYILNMLEKDYDFKIPQGVELKIDEDI